jgi:hypothetical protein
MCLIYEECSRGIVVLSSEIGFRSLDHRRIGRVSVKTILLRSRCLCSQFGTDLPTGNMNVYHIWGLRGRNELMNTGVLRKHAKICGGSSTVDCYCTPASTAIADECVHTLNISQDQLHTHVKRQRKVEDSILLLHTAIVTDVHSNIPLSQPME